MARPKGIKNKNSVPTIDTAAIEEKMKALESEIAELAETAKAKKNELKTGIKQIVKRIYVLYVNY